MTLETTSLKRCRGWHFAGHIGATEHQLPKTLEFFHKSNYALDGFNGQCKACVSAYGSYRLRVDRERREAKKRAAGGDVAAGASRRASPGNSLPAASPEVSHGV